MMRAFIVVAAVAAATVAVYFWFRPPSRHDFAATTVESTTAGESRNPGRSTATAQAPGQPPAPAPASGSSQIETPPAASGTGTLDRPITAPIPVRIPDPPDFPDPPPLVVMERTRAIFRKYSSLFNGNPVGTNPEITAALNGGNLKQIRFIDEADGLRINEKGELIDPWGTPFFFHQLSAKEMEIHSAGPDRVLWTADDLMTK
jgi:hypothetical protein